MLHRKANHNQVNQCSNRLGMDSLLAALAPATEKCEVCEVLFAKWPAALRKRVWYDAPGANQGTTAMLARMEAAATFAGCSTTCVQQPQGETWPRLPCSMTVDVICAAQA